MGCCQKPSNHSEEKNPHQSGCCSSHHSHSHEHAQHEHAHGRPQGGGCCSSSYEAFEEEEEQGGCCGGGSSACCEEEAPEHIDAQMTIQDILTCFPAHSQRLAQELTQIGLQCVGCQASVYETLEAGMKRHGMDAMAIARLLDKLNAILEEHSDPDTITLTPRAARKYLSILESEGKDGWALRFGDRPAGCSGFEYVLDYSEKATPEDVVFVSEGIEIHVHRSAVNRLKGSLIDYVDGLHASGFKISNCHARSSCACGSSHNY